MKNEQPKVERKKYPLTLSVAAGVLAGIALARCDTGGYDFESEAHTAVPTVTVTVASQPNIETQTPNHAIVDVVRFSPPENSPAPTASIESELNVAGVNIMNVTENAYGLRLGSVKTVTLEPEGKTPGGDECFESDDLFDAAEKYRNSSDRITAMIGNSAILCDEIAGQAKVGENMIALQGPNAHIMAHEVGHLWGLGHYGKIGCYPINRSDQNTDPNLVDVSTLVTSPNCGVQKSGDEINEYGSLLSAMGNNTVTDNIIPIYSNSDLHQLMSEKFTDRIIANEPGKYRISYEAGTGNSITMQLPSDHPLRLVDKNISSLTFTLDITGGSLSSNDNHKKTYDCAKDTCTVSVTANAGDMRYQIETPYSSAVSEGTPEYFFESRHDPLNQKGGDYNVWYIDEKLNIVVRSSLSTKNGAIDLEVLQLDKNKTIISDRAESYRATMDKVLKAE
jgi:hypothetical protein